MTPSNMLPATPEGKPSVGQTALDQLAAEFGVRPRFMPVIGDSMEPTLRNGDLVAVDPVETYRAEGLYVLDFGYGPEIFRVQRRICSRQIEIWRDNKESHYNIGNRMALLNAQFEAALLGKIFATVKVIDDILSIRH